MSETFVAAALAAGVLLALWRLARPRTTTATLPEAQPRDGVLSRQGRPEPVRFRRDPNDPGAFVPVDLEGNDVTLLPGDRLSADVLGPGQSIKIDIRRAQ